MIQLVRTLRWYQQEAFDYSSQFNGSALYMVQGTGKTTVAIAMVCHKEAKRIIIVCPPNVMDTWETEIKECVEGEYKIHHMIGGQKASMPKATDKVQFIIISYTTIWVWRKELAKWYAEFVIVDESQSIKKRTSQQSKAVHKLNKAPYKLCLSGTPIDESGLDVYSQYKFCCPEIFGEWADFKSKYARNSGYGFTNWVVRKKKEPELIRKIRSRMFRVERDVLELSKPKFITVKYDLSHTIKGYYNTLLEDNVVDINGHQVLAPIAITKIQKLAQICTGWVRDDEDEWVRTHTDKQAKFYKLLKKLMIEEDKVVVFTKYRGEVADAKHVCKVLGVPFTLLTGDTPKEMRMKRREKFRDCKGKRVFITQIRAGGVGVNELKVARDAIFYGLGHSWIDYDQALSRLFRSGQKRQVRLWHLMARGTVEEEIYKVVRQKGTSADVILNTRRVK